VDDIGLGKFLANSLVTMEFAFLLILNVTLFIFREKKAKWFLFSIILNIISAVYFGGYVHSLIVFFNLVIWPLFNLVFILILLIKYIVISFKNRNEERINHKKFRIINIILGVILSILIIWFSIVAWFFLRFFL
jgi:hypothetical protein